LLYVFGAATALLLLSLAAVAAARHRPVIKRRFRSLHGAAACLALLGAAAHWWPFALLLCPAVAVAATGAAVDAQRPRNAPHSATQGSFLDGQQERITEAPHSAAVRAGAAGLAAALAASVAGLACVWALRARVMGRERADTYTAFAFPPLAVAASAVAARTAASAVVGRWWPDGGGSGASVRRARRCSSARTPRGCARLAPTPQQYPRERTSMWALEPLTPDTAVRAVLRDITERVCGGVVP